MSAFTGTNWTPDNIGEPDTTRNEVEEIGTGHMMRESTAEVLSIHEVEAMAFRFQGTGTVAGLCQSHEALRRAYFHALTQLAWAREQLEDLTKQVPPPVKVAGKHAKGTGW